MRIITKSNWKNVFYPFWASQMLSVFGSMLVQFTLIWWLTEKTGSAAVLATASLVGLLPELLIQPFAGAIVDRINRKTVIMVADAIIAFASLLLAILFLLGRVEIWMIYVLMVLRSVGGGFSLSS
jgi:DHA3 family macrolide efflux protein-like MFS transporter